MNERDLRGTKKASNNIKKIKNKTFQSNEKNLPKSWWKKDSEKPKSESQKKKKKSRNNFCVNNVNRRNITERLNG